jgi:CBS domain-containing protein
MNPREMSEPIVQQAPTVRQDDTIEQATRALLDGGLPALPVVHAEGLLVGLFGEREFMEALFPGYVGQLGYAGFVSGRLDDALEKRAACRVEPVSQHMNTEHVSVDEEFSDVGVAEIFIHHRVLVVPVERNGRPIGVITRSAFFQRLAERFLERT